MICCRYKPAGAFLQGPLSPYIGNLTELLHIYLFTNKFNGALPPELGKLSELQRMLLKDNEFTGTIPQEVGQMTKLRDIYLYNIFLDGLLDENQHKVNICQ